MKIRYFFFIFLSFILSFLASCSKNIGYSVVLWGDEKNGLHDGELVTVLVKSNITHTYIIELPNNENKEIPIWQLSSPEPKKKALQTAQIYEEYTNTFASVKLDGLPIRADAANTAKQVYRLRKGEIIRILYKGEGTAVNNGKGNMTGEWYRVLTSEGTQGWCFSYNLDIYESENGGQRETEIVEENKENIDSDDKNMKILKGNRWYPDEYKKLIKDKRIDLQIMSTSYGFTFDEKEGRIVLATADDEKYWKFNSIRKLSSKQFQFDGANVNVTVKAEDEIVVQFIENGKPKNAFFVSFKEDISEIINKEIQRRNKQISSILGTFSSENYGNLTISGKNGNFSYNWQNFNLLVPSIIPSSATGSGKVTIDYFIADSLKSSYDGILTFDFNGTKINFLYKMTADGLRLEDAVKATIKDNVVTKRSSSPTIVFFEKK